MQLGARLEELVTAVEAAWEAERWQREAFPEVAVQALERAGVGEQSCLDDWLRYLLSREALPRQVDPFNTFGEPPITLAFRARFALDLYFWHKPVVDIHNHSFDGAFSVVEGASLHTRYRFAPGSEAGAVVLGEVEQSEVELLKRGVVRPIQAGIALVHQVAHLSSPCLSLVLRSHPDESDPPIYTFLPPRTAILQRRYLNESEQKQLALVGLVAKLRASDGAEDLLAPMLARAGDLLQAWSLRYAAESAQDLGMARRLVDRIPARDWHRPLLAAMAETDVVDVAWDTLAAESYRLVVAVARATTEPATRERIAGEYRAGARWADLVVEMARGMAPQWTFGMGMPDVVFIALRAFVDGADDREAAGAMARALGAPEPAALLEHVQQTRAFFGNLPLLRRLI